MDSNGHQASTIAGTDCIQPDYTVSPRVYLRALLAVRADSGAGAGPEVLPSKYIHAQPPITHDRSADLLHVALNFSPVSIPPVGDHMYNVQKGDSRKTIFGGENYLCTKKIRKSPFSGLAS